MVIFSRSSIPSAVRLKPLRANGSPAFAVYQMDASGVYRAAAIHILTIKNGAISEINDFLTSTVNFSPNSACRSWPDR